MILNNKAFERDDDDYDCDDNNKAFERDDDDDDRVSTHSSSRTLQLLLQWCC